MFIQLSQFEENEAQGFHTPRQLGGIRCVDIAFDLALDFQNRFGKYSEILLRVFDTVKWSSGMGFQCQHLLRRK